MCYIRRQYRTLLEGIKRFDGPNPRIQLIMVCSVLKAASFLVHEAAQKTAWPSCSKLTMSLVNDSLKFQVAILQIHCCFLLKKCENPLQYIFFSTKYNGVFA